ncbi:MAG: hypothetical protein QXV82_09325 [Ignisphaera sp.]
MSSETSIKQILGKATLRSIVTLITILFFYFLLAIVTVKSEFKVVFEGRIDVTLLFGFLTGTLLTVIIEYLFRR